MSTVRIEYYGMEGIGRNVTEAKRDAGRKVELALSGSYTPELIVCGKYAALLFRQPSGWGYRIITDEVGAIRQDLDGRVYASCHDDYAAAKRSAIHHIAQCGMDWKTIVSADDVPAIVTDGAMRRELHGYAAWQRCARYARVVLEMDSHDAHAYACQHSAEWMGRKWDSESIAAVSAAA